MRITVTTRRKIIAFVVLVVCLTVAVTLSFSWIILHWRQGVLLFFGTVFFLAIIVGLILNTSFLLREIRRNEQHDSFLNAVTHELKTPIASIRLYLETLQRRDVGEAQRQEFYRSMLDDTSRLLGTVNQVLKAGEVGYGRAAQHRGDVDLAELVRECVDLARTRHRLEAEAIKIEPVNGQPTTVNADAEDLRIALGNILDNAVKYSNGRVDVAVKIASADEKHITLRVHDEGVGIPPQELKRVFKRFYRVPGRTHVKGTGLGLFIVRSIARAHGGRVSIESEGEGRGTTVVLELPRSAA
ncbi:MAG TPA: HAMP domain-containing sensor histidine kinase [Candidatus Acidoferrales bacterium]